MFEHVKCETADLAKQNLEKLKALFPGVVTEGPEGTVINVEALKQECSATPIEGNVEHYEFTWPGKMKAKAEANRPTTKTLRPCRAESVGKDGTPGGFDSENLYIEGDNLEVLKLLRMNYAGKVKMIYIDPPYNTGHDFVYRDRFSLTQKELESDAGAFDDDGNRFEVNDSSEARYHSNWCSMMYPRLKLARELLRDDGFLFVSLDDNESHNARKLIDEIFGGASFIADVCHKARASISNDKIVSANHNHVLWVSKDRETAELHRKEIGLDPDLSGFDRDDNDGRGPYKLVPVDGPGGARKGNPYYEFLGVKQYFRFSKETMERMYSDGLIVKNGDSLQQKYFLRKASQSRKTDTTWWEDAGLTSSSTAVLKALMGSGVFDNPKPISLIERMLKLVTHFDSDAVVLDFFSGSATTAHAVMQLNAEDGGNRKFIMVQLPEPCAEDSEAAKAGYKNICEIGKERIRRAGKKISEELRAKSEELKKNAEKNGPNLFDDKSNNQSISNQTIPDIGFRVLKLAEGSYLETSKKVGEITQASLLNFSKIKDDRTGEDLLFQVLLETDVKLSESIDEETIEGNKVYFVGGTAIAAALEANMKMTEEFVKVLAARKPGTVFFRDDSFGGKDDLKISVGQIFKQMTGDLTKVKVI